MNRNKRPYLLVPATAAVLALAGCSASTSASTQSDADWAPTRNVTVVVPYAAGGGSDAFARVIAAGIEDVEPDLTVTVENREGGGGAVGVEYFRSLKGDAQSLLAGSTPIAVPGSATETFTLLDYSPLAVLAEDTTALVASSSAGFDDCEAMLEVAETERLVGGTSGEFTIDGMLAELVASTGDGNFDNVAFESGGEIIAGLLGDQIDVGFVNLGEVAGQVESGDIKVLCTTGRERFPYEGFEDVPTASEQGLDAALTQFRAVIGAPEITDAQSAYWVDVLERVYETDGFQEYLTKNMLTGLLLVEDEFEEYITEQEQIIAEVTG
ncbi:MAG TPA: tripartite tricarboxylate transporter substrate-binding protein [Microbacterium sp.]|nr:tripartite tricarboxylate transporter substrate-binding protein [Microbacterium sp.]